MRHRMHKIAHGLGTSLVILLLASCGTTPAPTSNATQPSSSAPTAATGPMLGAWWDAAAGGLRIINGVAGAASEAKPIYNDGTYTGAAVCMRQSIALLTASSGALFLTRLPQAAPVPVTSQSLGKPQVVFSPSCSAALAYTPGKSSALLLQGLTAAVHASTVALPGGTATAAVADSGSILASVPQADGAAAIELLAAGTARPVATLSKFGGMSFVPGSDTALVADQGTSTVVEAVETGGSVSLTQLAGPADGIAQPLAVAASSDGHSAAIVNAKNAGVVRIDLTGQTPAFQAVCRCSPAKLEPLAGNLAFRVNDPGSATVWAFDGDAATARFVFLPAEQNPPAAQGAQP